MSSPYANAFAPSASAPRLSWTRTEEKSVPKDVSIFARASGSSGDPAPDACAAASPGAAASRGALGGALGLSCIVRVCLPGVGQDAAGPDAPGLPTGPRYR